MDSQIVGSLISATATIIAAIIGGWVAVKIKDMELKAKEERTGELLTKAEKKAAHWLWGLFGAGVGAGIIFAIMVLIGNPSVPFDPIPQNFLTQREINRLFGENNWFCFPDRDNGIGVKRLPANIIVKSPLFKLDTDVGNYQLGETAIGLGATAWLDKRLPQSECPPFQQDALPKWTSAHLADSQPFNQARINELFGIGNWQCLDAFDFAVKVFDLSPSFAVEYPFTAIDNSYGRYGVGEIIPERGAATVWLGGSIPKNECP